MAIVVTSIGTGQDKALSTTVSAPSASYAVGDWIIVVVAGDSAATDSNGNGLGSAGGNLSLTKNVEIANTGNVITSIWSGKVLTAGTTTVNAGFGATDAKCIAVYKVTGLADSPFDKSVTATGSSNSPDAGNTATALSQADELVIGAIGTEGPDGDTAGAWVTATNHADANVQRLGTTGAGAASNITVHSATIITTTTTAAGGGKTGATSRDWAAAVATYKAASGTNYPLSMAGTLASAGVLAKVAKPVRAGTLATAGVLSPKDITKPGLAGTLTTAGALTKQRVQAFAGTLATAGAYAQTRITALAFAGTLATSGALTRVLAAYKTLAGTLATSGVMTKVRIQGFAGTLTTAGALVAGKAYFRNFAGTLATAGVLIKIKTLPLAGTLATSGVLARTLALFRSYAGTLATSGTLAKRVLKPLAGTLTTSGAYGRVLAYVRTFVGTLATSGGLVKVVSRPLAGVLTTSGVLAKSKAAAFAGTLAMIGALSHVYQKGVPSPTNPWAMTGKAFYLWALEVGAYWDKKRRPWD